MYSDRKRYLIVRKDLITAVKRARTLDDLLAMMKRKYSELTGSTDPYSVQTPPVQTKTTINIGTPPPPPSPPPPPPPPPSSSKAPPPPPSSAPLP
ncbi:MAG: hypothetical protein HWN66_21260, partial [Candidatus Helarchaeota archaeon]|nr:hypothetical protein [Candidatus Helarchaeota archaeon]